MQRKSMQKNSDYLFKAPATSAYRKFGSVCLTFQALQSVRADQSIGSALVPLTQRFGAEITDAWGSVAGFQKPEAVLNYQHSPGRVNCYALMRQGHTSLFNVNRIENNCMSIVSQVGNFVIIFKKRLLLQGTPCSALRMILLKLKNFL